jgi:hypothetical protein
LCKNHFESTQHLFLQCPFALAIWNLLSSATQCNVNLSSCIDVLNICNRNWNLQCKVVLTSTVISIFNAIWLCRNNLSFKNLKPNMNSVIASIISNVSIVTSQF